MTRHIESHNTCEEIIETKVALKQRNKIDIAKIKNRMGIANKPQDLIVGFETVL
jgi:hypothetical protein